MLLDLFQNSLLGLGLVVSYKMLDKITKGKPFFAILSSTLFLYCVDKLVLAIEGFV